MPKYCYKCENCDHQFQEQRPMSERASPTTCPNCGIVATMFRIPQIQSVTKQSNVGKGVETAIKENLELLKQQKKERLKEAE